MPSAASVMALLFLVWCMVMTLAIVFVPISAVRQHRFRRTGTPISPLAAEAMTRDMLDNTRAVIVISFVLAAALELTGDRGFAALVAYIPVTRLVRLVLARRFLAYLESQPGPVTLHGNLLAVHRDRYIVVPRSIARDAKQYDVPVAISRG